MDMENPRNWYAGMKVVCVVDTPLPGETRPAEVAKIKAGNTYVIREVCVHDFYLYGEMIGVKLVGISRNVEVDKHDHPWGHIRFKPLTKTDISVFERLLINIPVVQKDLVEA